MFRRLSQTSYLRTVRAKLSIASIVCILVPALLTMLIYNGLTKDAVEEQARSNAVDAMKLVNGSVNNTLQGMLNVLNYIQIDSDMNAFFKRVSESDATLDFNARFTATSRIMKQLESLSYIGERSYISIILTNGTTFTNYSKDEFDPLLLQKEPWFKKLGELEGLKSYWVGATPTMFPYDRLDSPYQLSVARTLRLDSSKIYGYAVVTLMENKLSRIFEGLTSGQDVMLVDVGGAIISSPDEKQIGQSFHFADQLTERSQTPASRIIEDGKQKMLLTSSKLTFTDWYLVAQQPYEEAILNISSIFNRVFLFQLVSFFVFLMLLLLLMRTFTKPLIRLGRVATSVQRGNLEVRSGVRGQDEIGRLGFLFDQMLDRIKEMIAEVSLTQARKRKAELAMLQAQINPHFLFNVLNSIRMKVMRGGDQESAKMIASLSRLLRMTITRDEDAITLHEEIELLTHYVELMNLRQKEEVRLVVDVDVSAFHIEVPRFILQPIVENALIHGLNRSAGTIRVGTLMKERFLELSVEDDGTGMEPEQLERMLADLSTSSSIRPEAEAGGERTGGGMSGIGVVNVAERMRIMFGDAFQLTVSSTPGAGTRMVMQIPLARGEQAACIR
ncbi:two-component system sensor histidine kinase YesM [Paenibacillus phyllosphaerae]|uniref:histidine kinase n=1 Tax=Paenibacillus phyllosphaerae TaxID=274593 RepID=A0A7W5FRG7_9BACL|nr:sensor histidine kinase [Paenibacillus phyllosphaerae]MBB3113999.1 two-component system sensor histidine kinase YesM [Paenibacillus phyllosphaerae]